MNAHGVVLLTALVGLAAAFAAPGVASAQLSPQLRHDDTPTVWLDVGNRVSTGGALEVPIEPAWEMAFELGYIARLAHDESLGYVTATGAFEPPEQPWFVELELEGAHLFEDNEFVAQVLGRFVWVPSVGPRVLAFWLEAGYSSEQALPAAFGIDVPLLPRHGGRLIAVHLFGEVGTLTEGVVALAETELVLFGGARLSWRNGTDGEVEIAFSAVVERTWAQLDGPPSTAWFALMSLRWYR